MKPAQSLMSKMRGICVNKFGGLEELIVTKDIPVPKVEETKVCIEIHSSGVNPVDTYIRSGTHILKPKSLPYIPGKDGAGIVRTVGGHVTRFKPGDRVFVCNLFVGSGTLAEHISIEESSVHPLSDKLSFDEGAAMGIPYWTAYRALFQRGQAKKDEKVLIHGASGSVGTAVLQLARAKGFTYIVGTAGTAEGQERILAMGATASYCHRDEDYIEKMKNDHEGFDVIIEMLANVNLQKDLQMVRRNSRIVIVGSRGDVTVTPRFLMGPEASILGCSLVSTTEQETAEAFEEILSSAEKGEIKPPIGKIFTLEQVRDAHDYVINNSGSTGKVIVRVKE